MCVRVHMYLWVDGWVRVCACVWIVRTIVRYIWTVAVNICLLKEAEVKR